MYNAILKRAGIKGVRSYKDLYGTVPYVFAMYSNGSCDSAWYCEIKSNYEIVINTKYYDVPEGVITHNNNLQDARD